MRNIPPRIPCLEPVSRNARFSLIESCRRVSTSSPRSSCPKARLALGVDATSETDKGTISAFNDGNPDRAVEDPRCNAANQSDPNHLNGRPADDHTAVIVGIQGQATVIVKSSRPAMPPTIRSPLTTAATPAGVPV